MKKLLTIISLFSFLGLAAQPLLPQSGLAPKRGDWMIYPSEELASKADTARHTFRRNIYDFEQDGFTFKQDFIVPFAWINRQVFVHVDWAKSSYSVWVNGREVDTQSNGSLPSEMNITKFVKEGRNKLEIRLEENSKYAILENWQERSQPQIGRVWTLSQPTLHIRDVVVKTWQGEQVTKGATAEIGIIVKTLSLNPRTSRIYYSLLNPAGKLTASGKQDITLKMRGEDTLRFVAQIHDTLLWSASRPQHFTLRLKTQHEGRYEEYVEIPVGLRAIRMNKGQMFINGQPADLQMREVDPQISDEELMRLKNEGYNTLKLLPGVVREGLMDFCDQKGIYLISQAAVDTHLGGLSRVKGGNLSNNTEWRTEFIKRAEDNYHATKRHPSVIGFSIANKSANGINLYESYLNMKHLGDQRPILYLDAEGEWNNDILKIR